MPVKQQKEDFRKSTYDTSFSVPEDLYKIFLEPPNAQYGRSLKPLISYWICRGEMNLPTTFPGEVSVESVHVLILWYFNSSIPLCVHKSLVFLIVFVIYLIFFFKFNWSLWPVTIFSILSGGKTFTY